MPEFLHHYYTTVSSSLKKFGVDLLGEGYTFESFYQDFRMYSGWGMFASLMVTATILDLGILESEIVCDRWLKLIDEVKEIYLAVSLPCFFWKSDNYSHSEKNCMF